MNNQSTRVPNLNRNQSLASHQTPPPPLPKPRGVIRVQSVDSVGANNSPAVNTFSHSSNIIKGLTEGKSSEETNFYRDERFSSSCRNISKTASDHWTSLPCQQEILSSLSQSESDVQCKNVEMSLQDNLISAKNSLMNGNRCAISNNRSVSVSDIRRVFESQASQSKSPSSTSSSFSREKLISDIDRQSQSDSSNQTGDEDALDEDKKQVESAGETSENPTSIESSEHERVVFRSNHSRVLSTDSTASDSGNSSPEGNSANCNSSSIGSRTSSVSNLKDSQFGSVTSLASTTSLISPQELQALIDEANQSLEGEVYNQNAQIQVIVLHREYNTSGSIGITLAGGSDYETKEIIVSYDLIQICLLADESIKAIYHVVCASLEVVTNFLFLFCTLPSRYTR